jgi:protease IV
MEQQSKEWQLLEKVALESFREQRRARRWGIFFKFLTFVYLFAFIVYLTPDTNKFSAEMHSKTGEHTALVRMQGIIMEDEMAGADNVVTGLRAAFESKHSKAVMLAINSPGGSPVQAGYVYDEIVRLRAKYPEKKVYAVISDTGASAAYYIASAADQVYADKASLVGSIGVISASFGFTGAMEKLGIDRRVMTAGENKAFLDPYQPLKDEEKVFWEKSLAIIHAQFIDQVRKGRGDRLKENEKIFSGFIWTGEEALAMGLVDGLGSAGYVAREIIGVEDIVDYSVQPNPLDKFFQQLGASAGTAMSKHMTESASLPRVH